MRRIGGTASTLGLVASLGLLLGGCTWFDNSTMKVADGLAWSGEKINAPWGSMRAASPEQSTTIARLRGAPVELPPLETEGGDVWPVPEAPRATLANPDAAMRGIPSYQPGELDRMSGTAPRSQWQPTDPPPVAPMPPGLMGSSSPPPSAMRQPEFPPPASAPSAANNSPPPRRADGRTILTPQGPVTTLGGTDRVQTYTTPGGGVGTAHIDGGFTTLTGPDGRVQTIPTPR